MLSFTRVSVLASLVAAAILVTGGCAQQKPVSQVGPAVRPDTRVVLSPHIRLAAYQVDPTKAATSQPSPSGEQDAPPGTADATTNGGQPATGDIAPAAPRRDAQAPARGQQPTGPAKKPAYTAPSVSVRYLAVGAVAASAAVGMAPTVGGREAAEASLVSSQFVAGQPGLAAPQPTFRSTVINEPGLVGARLAGFTAASANNIFTANVNPRSGAGGRCQELVGSGFFGGSQSACRRGLHR